jgi:tetratricopeptide (TPR) repeat protein
MYIEIGDMRRALAYTNRALALDVRMGSREGKALNRINLGTIHVIMGRIDVALHHLTYARMACEAVGNSSGLYSAQRWLAELYLATGHHERAAELAQSALDLARNKGHGQAYADSLNVVAGTCRVRGQHRSAIRLQEEVMAWATRTGARGSYSCAEALVGLGRSHTHLGRAAKGSW